MAPISNKPDLALIQACAVLAANDAAEDGSFVHALHERDAFDERTFWALYDAMSVIADTPPRSRKRETQQMAAQVHKAILMHVIYHLNPNDSSRIDGFPADKLYDWLDRLEWVFNPVVCGKPGYGPGQFNDGLPPPRGGYTQH